MSEALTRCEPESLELFEGEGVTISLAPPYARFSLRAQQDELPAGEPAAR